MNSINLVGRIVRDCELKFFGEGGSVVKFTLAVDRPYKNKKGEKETDFIPVVAFNKDKIAEYLLKGKLISITGAMNIDRYEDKDGNKKTYAKVTANNITLLSTKNSSNSSNVFDKSEAVDTQFVPIEFDDSEIPF